MVRDDPFFKKILLIVSQGLIYPTIIYLKTVKKVLDYIKLPQTLFIKTCNHAQETVGILIS